VLPLYGFDPLGPPVNPREELADALGQGFLGVTAAGFASDSSQEISWDKT
jgi:hypothetical protein